MFLLSKQLIPIVATAPERLNNCLNGNYVVWSTMLCWPFQKFKYERTV